MTDNEIIKSMQCVIGNDANCSECTYQKVLPFPSCRMMCAKNALDLINRQKSEIERLAARFNDYPVKTLIDNNNMMCSKSSEDYDKWFFNVSKDISYQAIKEFAERLKMECYATYDEVLPSLFADIIDKLVKEMTERDGK